MKSDISQDNNKRIAKNTLVLYFRMLFLMAVTLYTSRVVINALGFEDYGIYTAVGGFVAMFAVISNSLTAAISRFITYTIGSGNKEKLNRVFTTSLMIQGLIAGVVLLLLETGGIWFLNFHMTIPEDRLLASNFVMQFSIFTFVVQLINVPYNAAIIAHEHMSAYAFISILNAVGTLFVALIVKFSTNIDQLILYSLLLALVAVVVRFVYGWYCSHHFEECKFRFTYNKPLLKEILSFAGWNFFGASSAVLRDQGINVLLNIYCGPVVNAARGIAMQVSSAVQSFSGSFTSALNPQITKQFAAGEMAYTFKLCFKGARFSFYLLLLLSLPIFVEAEKVLNLWLGNIPPHTVNFVRLIVVYAMVESISSTLITLMLATGNIKKYQIVVGGTQLLNFPIALFLLYLGAEPEYTMVATILIAMLCMFFRLRMLQGMVGLPILEFMKSVIVNIVVVTIVASVIPVAMLFMVESTWIRFFLSILCSLTMTCLSVYFVGCNLSERAMLLNKVKNILNKIKHENR